METSKIPKWFQHLCKLVYESWVDSLLLETCRWVAICPHCGAGFCQKRRVLRPGPGTTIPHGVVPELIGSGYFFFRTPSFLWLPALPEAQGNLLVLTLSCCEINDDFSFVSTNCQTYCTSRDPKPHFFQRNSGGQRKVLSSCLFDRQSGSYLRRASKETRGCPRMGYPKNQPGLPYHNISQ